MWLDRGIRCAKTHYGALGYQSCAIHTPNCCMLQASSGVFGAPLPRWVAASVMSPGSLRQSINLSHLAWTPATVLLDDTKQGPTSLNLKGLEGPPRRLSKSRPVGLWSLASSPDPRARNEDRSAGPHGSLIEDESVQFALRRIMHCTSNLLDSFSPCIALWLELCRQQPCSPSSTFPVVRFSSLPF
jgi:hypothetical protein